MNGEEQPKFDAGNIPLPLHHKPITTIKDILAQKILGEEAAEKLKEYHEAIALKDRINTLWREINTENERHNEAVKHLQDGIRKMQGMCKHQDTTYHPDPSGNNDSYTECNICGKSL